MANPVENTQILGQIADIASIAGFIIGIPAFFFAYVQLRRTRKAAEAATKAMNETLQRVSTVVAVASLEQICGRSRELLRLMQDRKYTSSAMAVVELQEALSKFSTSKAALSIQNTDQWSEIMSEVIEMQHDIQSGASIRKFTDAMMRRTSAIHSKISSLTGIAGDRAGEFNVNTE
jgi:hypothetical protein